MDQEILKRLVGKYATRYVEDDMTVGVGSGTTVKYFVEALAEKVKNNNLKIKCVATSSQTARQAKRLKLPVYSLCDINQIDLTIDGADEIDSNMNGIKGGGAALLREKIVATNSQKNIWIVDHSKLVKNLGRFPLPVEVIPFGYEQLMKKFEALGYQPVLRTNETSAIVKTDSNNYILDLHLGKINDPIKLATILDSTVGVVEHGLFLNVVDEVVVGNSDGISVLKR